MCLETPVIDSLETRTQGTELIPIGSNGEVTISRGDGSISKAAIRLISGSQLPPNELYRLFQRLNDDVSDSVAMIELQNSLAGFELNFGEIPFKFGVTHDCDIRFVSFPSYLLQIQGGAYSLSLATNILSYFNDTTRSKPGNPLQILDVGSAEGMQSLVACAPTPSKTIHKIAFIDRSQSLIDQAVANAKANGIVCASGHHQILQLADGGIELLLEKYPNTNVLIDNFGPLYGSEAVQCMAKLIDGLPNLSVYCHGGFSSDDGVDMIVLSKVMSEHGFTIAQATDLVLTPAVESIQSGNITNCVASEQHFRSIIWHKL